jgi:hypothetical protein
LVPTEIEISERRLAVFRDRGDRRARAVARDDPAQETVARLHPITAIARFGADWALSFTAEQHTPRANGRLAH